MAMQFFPVRSTSGNPLTSSRIEVAHNAVLNPSNITITAWIYPMELTANQRIIQKGVSSPGANGTDTQYRFMLNGSGELLFQVVGVGTITSSGANLQVNAWNFVAAGYGSGALGLYYNGTFASQAASGTMATTTDPLWIGGKFGSTSTNADYFNGYMEDVRIYNKVLLPNEVDTIYNSRGLDGMYDSMVARWPMNEDAPGVTAGTISTIAVNNPQGANASTSSNNATLSSYTVPAGSDLVLIVAATAEDGTAGNTQASSATFGGNAMTRITGVNTGGALTTYSGTALFYRAVNPGDSGNIVITYPGTVDNKTIHAYVLSGAQAAVDTIVTTSSNNNQTTTSLATQTANAIIVTTAAIGNANALSASGSGHVLANGQLASSSAGAIGYIPAPTLTTYTGIGYTSSNTNRMALAAISIPPANATAPIFEASDNKLTSIAVRAPAYIEDYNKKRRRY